MAAEMCGREYRECERCGRHLLVDKESHLCVLCEIEHLREQVTDRDLRLCAVRREKSDALTALADARRELAELKGGKK